MADAEAAGVAVVALVGPGVISTIPGPAVGGAGAVGIGVGGAGVGGAGVAVAGAVGVGVALGA